MRKNIFLVKSVLMSTLTAVTISFASCSDEDMLDSQPQAPEIEQEGSGDSEYFQPYGLTWHNFDEGEEPIQILNADTTEISVSKKLADRLGIESFVNHPLGIWQDPAQLPYARKAYEEQLVGDTYILKVARTTVAELIGQNQAELNTTIHVDENENSVKTRAADNNIPEYAAKYYDENGTIHPSIVHLTDPHGYDKEYHMPGEPAIVRQTRAAASGEYEYLTPEELVGGNTRWSSSRRIISAHTKFKVDQEFELDEASGDTINVSGEIPIDFDLNYYITLNGGFSFRKGIYVKKFEAGLNGNFAFNPEMYIGFSKKVEIDEKKQRRTLCEFAGYSFTFMVGPIPVLITCKPALFLKFNAGVEGSVHVGFKYEYANNFNGGIRYEDGKGWSTIKEFNEVANEFSFIKPEATFSAEAGAGLYVGVDVKIYEVAGPEAGVGPRLDLSAKMTLAPFADKKLDFEAEAKVSIDAFVGANIKILGWKLAEWSTNIDLAGPWVLAKFPNDGKTEIHLTKKGAELAKLRTEWDKVVEAAGKSDNEFREEFDTAIEKYMVVNKCSEADALIELYKQFNDKKSVWESTGGGDISLLYHHMESVVIRWLRGLEADYKKAIARLAWDEIAENLREEFDMREYDDDRYNTLMDIIFKHFYRDYNRCPDIQNINDIHYVMNWCGAALPNTAISGTGNVNGSEGASKAFDNNEETAWVGNDNEKRPGINSDLCWSVEFHTAVAFQPSEINLITAQKAKTCPQVNPDRIIVYAKENANDQWKRIYSNDHLNIPAGRGFHKSCDLGKITERYKYYRVEIPSIAGGKQMQIAEIDVQ